VRSKSVSTLFERKSDLSIKIIRTVSRLSELLESLSMLKAIGGIAPYSNPIYGFT